MTETNETPPIEPHNKEIIEAIKLGDTKRAILLAKNFCQNLKVDHSLWPGVTPHPDRIDQVRKSKLKLVGFPDAIKLHDAYRWEFFEKNILNPKYRKYYQKPEQIGNFIYDVGTGEDEWWDAARQELGGLFDYLDKIFDLKDKEKLLQIGRELSYKKISVLTAEFMTQHVGVGDHKVSQRDVIGFDGPAVTCPISHSKGVGMKYMAISTAEYLWMNIISANDIIKGSQTI